MKAYGIQLESYGVIWDGGILGVDHLPIMKKLYETVEGRDSIAARRIKLAYLWLLCLNSDWLKVVFVIQHIEIETVCNEIKGKLDYLIERTRSDNEMINEMIRKIDVCSNLDGMTIINKN